MRVRLIFAPGLIALVFVSVYAQPNWQSVVDRWNDMPLAQSNWGTFGMVVDPCQPDTAPMSLELPRGSGQEYLSYAALWIGALIDEEGFQTARVSVGADGWFNPEIVELDPAASDMIVERSRLDTTSCLGNDILDATAIADHEYQATFEDTLRDPFWVVDDPVDGPHRPLGLKITRTTYALLDPSCHHIYWIKYHIENIGSNFLKNIYLGHFVDVEVRGPGETEFGDDLCGYDAASGAAYWCDNDGRAFGDTSGNDFVVPNVVGMYYLPRHEYDPDPFDPVDAFVSFNWWISNGDVDLDYGPSWEAYCSRDSLDMGWTLNYGTPVGDRHKYQLMLNREFDYPYVYHVNQWPPPSGPNEPHAWCTLEPIPAPTPTDVKMLYSTGPLGIFEYIDQGGNRIYRLNPGEHFDCWVAMVGGMNLHDPEHPQHDPWIEPGYFDFSDFRTHVESAHAGCLDWAQSAEVPRPVADGFELSPIYPNPFNSQAQVRFSLRAPATVKIAVYNVLGRQAQVLCSQKYGSGVHEFIWDADNLASGIYFVRAMANDRVLGIQKAALMK
jgi:hypothetical protein